MQLSERHDRERIAALGNIVGLDEHALCSDNVFLGPIKSHGLLMLLQLPVNIASAGGKPYKTK